MIIFIALAYVPIVSAKEIYDIPFGVLKKNADYNNIFKNKIKLDDFDDNMVGYFVQDHDFFDFVIVSGSEDEADNREVSLLQFVKRYYIDNVNYHDILKVINDEMNARTGLVEKKYQIKAIRKEDFNKTQECISAQIMEGVPINDCDISWGVLYLLSDMQQERDSDIAAIIFSLIGVKTSSLVVNDLGVIDFIKSSPYLEYKVVYMSKKELTRLFEKYKDIDIERLLLPPISWKCQ